MFFSISFPFFLNSLKMWQMAIVLLVIGGCGLAEISKYNGGHDGIGSSGGE